MGNDSKSRKHRVLPTKFQVTYLKYNEVMLKTKFTISFNQCAITEQEGQWP